MTIRLYPSHMGGLPIETHEWTGTLAGFFASNGIDYIQKDPQPITVTVNGQWLPIDEWPSRYLAETDDVAVCLNTQYGGVFKGLGNVLGSVLGFAFGWLLPSAKGANNYNSPEQGKRLETFQAKANQARLGDAVPEIAGRFRRFPDYLTPPRRYFATERQQVLEFLACVGVGRYEILDSEVKIGNTPISDIDGASYQIKNPNESWGDNPRAKFWHTADEVGGTSSGTAGLELSTEPGNRSNSGVASYHFSHRTITKNAGDFPSGWGFGTVLTIPYPRSYSVDREVVDGVMTRNTFTGFFGHVDLSGDFFGSEWTLLVLADLGSGRKTVAFYKDVWEDIGGDQGGQELVRLWLSNVSPGSHTYTFQPELEWAVQSIGGSTIILQNTGNRFFESGVTVSTEVTFKGGAVYGEWSNSYVATPAKEKTQLLELDLFFPQGLCFISDKGQLQNQSASIEIEWVDVDTGERQSQLKSYTRATNDQIGFSEQITFSTPRQVSVRARRVGAQSTSTQVMDTVHWYGLKAQLPIINRYPNWTTLGVRIRSGGKLAAQSENQLNVIATRILPTLQSDGAWSAAQPTRDISAFVRYIARSIGYTDENIDMAELQRLHALWADRGETCDFIFDLTTVKEALSLSMGAGMAELTIADGLIRPVREGVRTQFEQSYSPQNMTKPLSRTFRARRHDDPDGVEVEYTDGETWTQQTIICALPGSQHLKLEKMRVYGVTDRTRAWRIGMRRARELAYQRWEYAFGTEMDALNSEYGGYVALFDDVPGYGQSALLQHIASVSGGVMLQVSEPLEWEEGKEHVVAYRRPDGTLAGPWPATPGPDEFSVIASIPSGQRPTVSLKLELPHVYFGTAERWTFPALIKQISPNGMEAASVSAVNYDERIYADDDSVLAN